MANKDSHGGRKTRIKNYKKTKHYRLSMQNRKNRRKKGFGE